MWEMTYLCRKWLKYLRNGQNVGNDVDLCKMSQICGEMAELFVKRLKNVENDFEIWEMAKIFGKWLRIMVRGLSINFEKRLNYVGKDSRI